MSIQVNRQKLRKLLGPVAAAAFGIPAVAFCAQQAMQKIERDQQAQEQQDRRTFTPEAHAAAVAKMVMPYDGGQLSIASKHTLMLTDGGVTYRYNLVEKMMIVDNGGILAELADKPTGSVVPFAKLADPARVGHIRNAACSLAYRVAMNFAPERLATMKEGLVTALTPDLQANNQFRAAHCAPVTQHR